MEWKDLVYVDHRDQDDAEHCYISLSHTRGRLTSPTNEVSTRSLFADCILLFHATYTHAYAYDVFAKDVSLGAEFCCFVVVVVVVVVVRAQQLISYHQLSRLRKSATVAGLSRRSCTVSASDGFDS